MPPQNPEVEAPDPLAHLGPQSYMWHHPPELERACTHLHLTLPANQLCSFAVCASRRGLVGRGAVQGVERHLPASSPQPVRQLKVGIHSTPPRVAEPLVQAAHVVEGSTPYRQGGKVHQLYKLHGDVGGGVPEVHLPVLDPVVRARVHVVHSHAHCPQQRPPLKQGKQVLQPAATRGGHLVVLQQHQQPA
eukprot:CAMPEP_0202904180 /NCGR_PEP_ID=MMETSP1392-20130828/28233_1 /ASSEMBLY_ACC=CAM_ASM_000868 /TAXON_ID=225041 /ORGANISM="Chlamydomonas chlamydogama, Strain SAG 11-48b" /LENGTH=189 /DNA_ID=CAMNT_0049591693 /DNA_START=503 /DNA_END=1072 /DNA_ORIENTATION=+